MTDSPIKQKAQDLLHSLQRFVKGLKRENKLIDVTMCEVPLGNLYNLTGKSWWGNFEINACFKEKEKEIIVSKYKLQPDSTPNFVNCKKSIENDQKILKLLKTWRKKKANCTNISIKDTAFQDLIEFVAANYTQAYLNERQASEFERQNYNLLYCCENYLQDSMLDTAIEAYSKQAKILESHAKIINIHDCHFISTYIDRENKRLYYFDSMSPAQGSNISKVSDDYLRVQDKTKALRKLDNTREKYNISPIMAFKIDAYTLIGEEYKDYTLIRNTTKFQTNGYDCGPWSTMFSHFMMYSDFRSTSKSSDNADVDRAFKNYILDKTNLKSENIQIFEQDPDLVGQHIRNYLFENFIYKRLLILQKSYKFPIVTKNTTHTNKAPKVASNIPQNSKKKSRLIKLSYLASFLTGVTSFLFMPLNFGVSLKILTALTITLASSKLFTYFLTIRKHPHTKKITCPPVTSHQLGCLAPRNQLSENSHDDVVIQNPTHVKKNRLK